MRGIIGFFDILGYQNFLENNSEIEYALEIIKLIEFLPQHVVKSIKDGDFSPEIKKLADKLDHLVFSDTIVLTIPFNEENDISEEITITTIMILAASKLTAQMFMIGLPARCNS